MLLLIIMIIIILSCCIQFKSSLLFHKLIKRSFVILMSVTSDKMKHYNEKLCYSNVLTAECFLISSVNNESRSICGNDKLWLLDYFCNYDCLERPNFSFDRFYY